MSIWDGISYRKKLLLVGIIATIAVYLGFRYILPLVFPFLISYFLAWTVRPATEFLHRKLKVPRILGGSISLILLISILGVGLSLLINNLIKQIISFLKNMPIYLNVLAERLDTICGSCDKLFGLSDGTVRLLVDENLIQTVNRVKNNIIPGITEHTISLTLRLITMLGIVLIIFISAVLIVKDIPSMKESLEGAKIYQNIHKVTEKLAETGIAYLKAQLIIMVIVGFLCVLGLTLIKYEYALLVGLIIAVLDALPILGSGIILIPWSIIMLINGNIYSAAIIITVYLFCQIIRQLLEPKLVGKSIGTKPLFTLISIYIGLQLFSGYGYFLGPIGLAIILAIVSVVGDKLKGSNDEFDNIDRRIST
mgnify:CR=1 FL=1